MPLALGDLQIIAAQQVLDERARLALQESLTQTREFYLSGGDADGEFSMQRFQETKCRFSIQETITDKTGTLKDWKPGLSISVEPRFKVHDEPSSYLLFIPGVTLDDLRRALA